MSTLTRRVYFNLHKRCLSVQTKTAKGWRVTEYANTIGLLNPIFKVSEAGRQRTIAQKRKCVHAVITGEMSTFIPAWISIPTTRVFYNPYKAAHFVDADGKKIEKVQFCLVKGDKTGYSIHVTK